VQECRRHSLHPPSHISRQESSASAKGVARFGGSKGDIVLDVLGGLADLGLGGLPLLSGLRGGVGGGSGCRGVGGLLGRARGVGW